MRLVDFLQISDLIQQTFFPNFFSRVTNSPDHNFIIKYMPSPAHEEAIDTWVSLLTAALLQLTTPPQLLTPGCRFIGSRSKFDRVHNPCLVSFSSLSV